MKIKSLVLPSRYAGYLINADMNESIDNEDYAAMDELGIHPGNCLSCREYGFKRNHAAAEFGILADDCHKFFFRD